MLTAKRKHLGSCEGEGLNEHYTNRETTLVFSYRRAALSTRHRTTGLPVPTLRSRLRVAA